MADKYNGKYPSAWTDAQVDTYVESGKEPAKASNGVWVVDITRDDKNFTQWTVAEMFALYNGEIESVFSAGDEAFLVALRVKARLSNAEAGKWSDDEVYSWLVTGKEPEKTKAGNFKNDPERFTKDVHLLNDSELIDFGLGEFGPYERAREYVLVEALDRFGLPLGTTFEDFAVYCSTNEKPKMAPHGSLINDRLRDGKLVSEWTEDEFKDWAVGAIGEGSLTVAELLVAAVASVGGEWYWSKADLGSYVESGVIPEPELVDLSAFHPAELLQFFRETHVEAAYDKWKALVIVEELSPAQFNSTVFVDKIPNAWSSREIYDYADVKTIPSAYNDNVWTNDVTREARIPDQLSVDEVEGCWHKKLRFTDEQRDAILKVAADSLRTHGDEKFADLYDKEALALQYDKKEPAMSVEGLLLFSKTRDELPLEEWTLVEVRAWLKGDILTKKTIDREALVKALTPQWEGLGDVAEREQWFINDTGPATTENGVLIEDPKRCLDSITNWSDAELKALAMGWIKGLDNVTEESLIAVLAEKGLIASGDWSLKQVVQFFTDGTVPEKTTFGSDVVTYDEFTITRKRDLKFFSDWANGKVTLPNSNPEILNRVRAIVGANTASDNELMTMLINYKGDGTDGFAEQPLHVQLQDGTEESRIKVVALWDMEPDTSAEWALNAYEAMDKATLARNDVLITDPRRDLKAAYLWSLEELRAWARGEIGTGTASNAESLCNAIRKKISMIEPGWDDGAVQRFAATGELPAKTSTGVLVVDLARDKKYPSDWTDAELRGWATGEMKTTVAPADILLAMRTRFKVPTKYTNHQVIQFVLTGEVPTAEPEKAFTNALAATDAQIMAFLRGEFELPADLAQVAFKETRARFKSDPQWTDAAIRTFYTDGTLPAKTSNGVFVEDRLRDITSCAKWSFNEVQSFAKKEIAAPAIPAKGAVFIDRARLLINVDKGLPATNWSIDEVLTYLTTGVTPTVLTGNVFANDPKRLAKAALSWSNEELKAWLRKEITATEKAPEHDLWDVVYNRFQVPNAWYPGDARSYVLTGATVPATPSGIWIRDRERDQRSAFTWTRAEVKAWARGQILPGLHAPEKDLVQQATLCFNLSASLSPEFIKEKVSAITEDTTPMTVSFVRDDLLSFAQGMKKEGADESKAAGYQSMLNRCIVRVCQLRGQDFVDGWTELLKFYYNQKNSIFTPGNLYNGVAMMTISSKAQKHFQYMTTVLFNTCDPETRDAAVKRIDWSLSLAGLPNDEARHQLLAFYNVN